MHVKLQAGSKAQQGIEMNVIAVLETELIASTQPSGPSLALKQCSGGHWVAPVSFKWQRGRRKKRSSERLKGVVSSFNPENHRVPSFVFKHFFFCGLI